MGSVEAISERQGASRYGVEQNTFEERYPEGISKDVYYKGEGEGALRELRAGIKQAMHGLGCRNLWMLRAYGYIVSWHGAPSKYAN